MKKEEDIGNSKEVQMTGHQRYGDGGEYRLGEAKIGDHRKNGETRRGQKNDRAS